VCDIVCVGESVKRESVCESMCGRVCLSVCVCVS
jgi:hypothetical protein